MLNEGSERPSPSHRRCRNRLADRGTRDHQVLERGAIHDRRPERLHLGSLHLGKNSYLNVFLSREDIHSPAGAHLLDLFANLGIFGALHPEIKEDHHFFGPLDQLDLLVEKETKRWYLTPSCPPGQYDL